VESSPPAGEIDILTLQIRQPVLRYTLAVVSTAVAVAAWLALPALHASPFMIMLTGIVLVSRLCGFGPVLVSTALSVAAIEYVMLHPHLADVQQRNVAQFSLFVLVCVLVGGLTRQRSQLQVAADRSRNLLAEIVESSEDAILSKDINGIISSWNAGAERMYGYRAEEVVGKHVSIIAPPDKKDDITVVMERLLRGERIQHYETERITKDGRRLRVNLSFSPLRDSEGKIIGASTIAQDITNQRLAEDALRKNEKLATAGRLSATIAHEINNPLEAVGNLLYLARVDKRKGDEYLAMAQKEVQRIAAIAHQTLSLVREATSAMPVNVSELLEEVLHLHSRTLLKKRIEVRTEYGRKTEIRGYPGELRQVFSNLLANAIDAMPEGGCLRLRVAPTRDWHSSATGVGVTVADNGHGIPASARVHLFEPFFTTKADTGTGLGLWISQRIVRKHEGWMRVHTSSRPGRSGTVFKIFLPYTAAETQAPGATENEHLVTSS
jgi:PAS domain S-box-containing protein